MIRSVRPNPRKWTSQYRVVYCCKNIYTHSAKASYPFCENANKTSCSSSFCSLSSEDPWLILKEKIANIIITEKSPSLYFQLLLHFQFGKLLRKNLLLNIISHQSRLINSSMNNRIVLHDVGFPYVKRNQRGFRIW